MSNMNDSRRVGRLNLGGLHAVGPGFLVATAMVLALAVVGCSDDGDASAKINGPINVPAGKPPGAFATVNGSIHVADNAEVTSAGTVNGEVHLGEHARAESLNSVNGAIDLGKDSQVSGAVASVNGELTLAQGADVKGSLTNVNGAITLTGAHVGGGIRTMNGSIDITGASRVEGGIRVQRPTGTIGSSEPRIIIGPGATVSGDLLFERPVKVFVSDKATIGTVTGASAVTFTGDSPPD